MPLSENDDLYNLPRVREVHSATSRESCLKMMQRFQKEGRNIQLKEIRPGTGDLPFYCVFEGPDAQTEYWEDRRYEKPDTTEGGS